MKNIKKLILIGIAGLMISPISLSAFEQYKSSNHISFTNAYNKQMFNELKKNNTYLTSRERSRMAIKRIVIRNGRLINSTANDKLSENSNFSKYKNNLNNVKQANQKMVNNSYSHRVVNKSNPYGFSENDLRHIAPGKPIKHVAPGRPKRH